MIFFLDENFPKLALKILQDQGHNVFDIRGSKLEGLDDTKLFDLCKEKEALFLTTDKDFYHTIHIKSKPHFGIVVIALSQPNTRSILEKLDWFLNNFANSTHNDTCYLILHNKCKIFR